MAGRGRAIVCRLSGRGVGEADSSPRVFEAFGEIGGICAHVVAAALAIRAATHGLVLELIRVDFLVSQLDVRVDAVDIAVGCAGIGCELLLLIIEVLGLI